MYVQIELPHIKVSLHTCYLDDIMILYGIRLCPKSTKEECLESSKLFIMPTMMVKIANNMLSKIYGDNHLK
jgi:hypothetical protein